jgi:hypothetical protein
MRFFTFGKAHTGLLYEFLPSADIGQVIYSNNLTEDQRLTTAHNTTAWLSRQCDWLPDSADDMIGCLTFQPM